MNNLIIHISLYPIYNLLCSASSFAYLWTCYSSLSFWSFSISSLFFDFSRNWFASNNMVESRFYLINNVRTSSFVFSILLLFIILSKEQRMWRHTVFAMFLSLPKMVMSIWIRADESNSSSHISFTSMLSLYLVRFRFSIAFSSSSTSFSR